MSALLEVSSLTKSFGGLTAVDDVSFEVGRGTITALIGPNGAGKTTVFNLLTGAIRPDRGRVAFDGEEVTGRPAHVLARLGMVRSFQTARMFPSMTVREIVTTAALLHSPVSTAAADADGILERLGLASRADARAEDLSLPDRQLVELAKCLATRPKLLLLDEIMGGLNRAECDVPVDAITALRAEGITFLLVEHVMPVVMSIADRIVVLDFGRRTATGTPAEIAANPEVQRSYLGDAR